MIVSSASTSSLLVPTPAISQVREVETAPRRRVIRSEITPKLRLTVSRGLAQLIRTQRRTSSFRSSGYPVAENALMGLAFLAGGSTDTSGPRDYVDALKLSTHTLLSYQKKSGYFHDGNSQMYGHGFATLFLAEMYGMSGSQNEKLRGALERAVRLIERSQVNGGWDYAPGGLPGRLAEYGGGDTSITVCQTLALRAARNLGILVDKRVVDRAKRFIWGAQNPDGGFGYRVNGKMKIKDYSEFPRSAAGVCVLYSLDDYSSPRMRKGVRYLLANYRALNDFPHNGQYYCAQAMFQVGGRHWRECYPRLRDYLVASQTHDNDDPRQDGHWRDDKRVHGLPGQLFGTAVASFVLAIPNRYLPILQEGEIDSVRTQFQER